MRDSKGFDLWAEEYDEYVKKVENSGRYPFAGYRDILNLILNKIQNKPRAKVLDIGFGTAPISSVLYSQGYEIWGQDFSKSMLENAQSKMPDAHLFLKDFSEGLDSEIQKNNYDFIIATYCLHHLLDNDQRISFIKDLVSLLNDSGIIMIGDVMFQNSSEREECRLKDKDIWDEEENYFIVDEIKKVFPNIKFVKYSYCSGLLSLSKD